MNKTSCFFFFRALGVALVLLCGSLNALASHMFGADLYYTHVSNNTYTINFAVYGDCSGAIFYTLASSAPKVEVYNGSSLVTTLTLNLTGPGIEVSPVCPSQLSNTTCNGGTLTGVKRYIYSATYNLGSTSANWKFRFNGIMSTSASAGRSNSITNIVVGSTAGSVMVLEATLNNTSAPNSSPVYTTIPTPFYCNNLAQQYNPGAVDANGDNLTYSLVPGLEPGNPATSNTNVTYITPYTATSPVAASAGSFTFSTTTGQLNFTPNLLQKSLVVGKVFEYRNGTLVGTSMREMTFVVINCNNNPPNGSITSLGGNATQINGTDVKICKSAGTLTFSINPTDANGDAIDVVANGLPVGAIFTVTGNNTTTPTASFSWNLAAVAPGDYTFYVTYTDAGCPLSSKQTVAYTVKVLPDPTVQFLLTSAATCAAKAVFIVTPGGNDPFTISELQGTTPIHSFPNLFGPQIDSLVPGAYTVRVADSNNCIHDTGVVLAAPLPVVPAVVVIGPVCNGGSNGSITVTSTTGTAPFQYALGSGGWGSSTAFTGLASGTYVLHIADANHCVKDTSIVVPVTPALSATFNFAKPPCNAFQSGSISVNAVNGTAPYQYALGSGSFSSNNVFTGLGSGSYVVHLKDINNCTADTTVLLPDSIRVQANIPLTNILCNGDATGAVTLNAFGATAPYTYAQGTGTFSNVNSYSGLLAGTYTFHIKDVDGCFLDTVLTLTQPAPLTATRSITNANCYGSADGGIAIAASGGVAAYMYALNAGAYGSAASFTGLTAGIYTVSVKDANNCIKNYADTVKQPTPLAFTIAEIQPLCPGGTNGSYTITASGSVPPYQYAIDAGAFGTSNTISGVAAGLHVLHLKDSHGCTKDTNVILGQPPVIVPAVAIKRPRCSPLGDGKIELGATGGTPGYTYAVGTGTYQASNVFSPLPAGVYTFHIKDANNCTHDTTITLVDSIIVHVAVTVTNATCYNEPGGALIASGFNAQSPYTYALNAGTYQTSGTFNSLLAGSYVVHAKDLNGCIGDTTVSVTQPPVIVPAVTLTQPTCYGGNNGSIVLSATGGSPGYTYAMGTGSYGNAFNFILLFAGTYTLHIKDMNNCIHDTTVILDQPTPLKYDSVKVDWVKCYGGIDGAVTVHASGATPPYQYSANTAAWQTTSLLGGFSYGNQVIHLKDANGCMKDTTVFVNQPSKLVFGPATIVTPTCEGFKDGVITVQGVGGSPSYKYSTNGVNYATANTFHGLPEGTYTYYLKDSLGCTRDTTINLVGYPHIQPNPIVKMVNCWGERNGRIDLNVSGGNQPLKYQRIRPLPVRPVVTDPVFDSLIAGSYTFTITDIKGCKKDTTIVITQPEDLALNPKVEPNDCAGLDNGGLVQVNVTGGTQPYQYVWSTNPVNTSASITGLSNGAYRVRVTDAHNCTDTATLKVEYNNCCVPFIPDAFSPNGDGRNDTYKIGYKGDMTLQVFAIYNRYGQRVFTTSKTTDGWDGVFEGKPCDMGVYFYYIKLICGNRGDNIQEFKGDVTLLR